MRYDVGAAERRLRPPDAAALHRRRGRGEDQAHPALGDEAAGDRHPAGHPRLPDRPGGPGGDAGEDRHVLQRRPGRRLHQPGREEHLRAAAGAAPAGPRRAALGDPQHLVARAPARALGADPGEGVPPVEGRGAHRSGRQVHRPQGELQEPQRGAPCTAASPTTAGWSWSTWTARRSRRRAPQTLLAGTHALLVPGGFGVRGHRGEDRRHPLRPREEGPLLRHLPGTADGGGGVRPQRARAHRRQLHRVRRADAPPGHLADGEPGSASRTRAAPCGWAPTAAC